MGKAQKITFAALSLAIVLSILYLYIPSETSVMLSPKEGDFSYVAYALWSVGVIVLVMVISFIGILVYSLVKRRQYKKKF